MAWAEKTLRGGQMKQARWAPNSTHAKAAEICETALKAMGMQVERGIDYRDGYDFLVEGRVRLAVRYAFPTTERTQTYKKKNGDLSKYVYKRWTFNFHRHGKISERYCDFIVCFLASPEAAKGRGSDVSVFTIPWEAITGLTFCSSCREGGHRPYRGKYAKYQDRWDLIAKAAGLATFPLAVDGARAPESAHRLPAELRRLTLAPGAPPKPTAKPTPEVSSEEQLKPADPSFRRPSWPLN